MIFHNIRDIREGVHLFHYDFPHICDLSPPRHTTCFYCQIVTIFLFNWWLAAVCYSSHDMMYSSSSSFGFSCNILILVWARNVWSYFLYLLQGKFVLFLFPLPHAPHTHTPSAHYRLFVFSVSTSFHHPFSKKKKNKSAAEAA